MEKFFDLIGTGEVIEAFVARHLLEYKMENSSMQSESLDEDGFSCCVEVSIAAAIVQLIR
ncbi:hypothetical protein KIN20_020963 [Parelaphostrongylus tenuis]|uniref:Uncharacterized protein n=1 Tax=Parelaphostrongylus tenuis TaxID=148309 RepID=A0AAD5NAD4_PARTN|nr:hypothetical protein KIN20_020963 [Parelaphostrongylus tenuis]